MDSHFHENAECIGMSINQYLYTTTKLIENTYFHFDLLVHFGMGLTNEKKIDHKIKVKNPSVRISMEKLLFYIIFSEIHGLTE